MTRAEQDREITRLDRFVDSVANDVYERLSAKAIQGYRGWNDPDFLEEFKERLRIRINNNTKKSSKYWLDIVAYAMFIYAQEKTNND